MSLPPFMADIPVPSVSLDDLFVHTSDDDPNGLSFGTTCCGSATNDSAATDILRKYPSASSKSMMVSVSLLIENPNGNSATDSRSSIGVALERALSSFLSSRPDEYNHLKIVAFRGMVHSDWPTWLQELMSSPMLDECISRLHTLKFNFITLEQGGRGASNEIYTINHPKGPNGIADTVTAEYTLMAEHIDRLTYLDSLKIPEWTIITTKLHVWDPMPDSLSLINITDDDVTPWNPLTNFLMSHAEISSLKIPGILSKYMSPAQFLFAIILKHNMEFLDLGGEHEKWHLALQLPY